MTEGTGERRGAGHSEKFFRGRINRTMRKKRKEAKQDAGVLWFEQLGKS